VLVRLHHLARLVVNANRSLVLSAVLAGVADCIAGSVRSVIPQATKWQHIGNQIDGATIFTGEDKASEKALVE